MEPRGHICVFVKPPRPGRVKTRLATRLGEANAAALAAAFFADTWSSLAAHDWARPIIAATEPLADPLAELLPAVEGSRAGAEDLPPPEIWQQGEGDLGQRIERILCRGLSAGDFAIAIGADSPGLPAHLLAEARAALADHDAVLGPSADGGFYLLGLKRCPAGLLADLPWSVSTTGERTAARLREAGLSLALLPSWFDVDRPPDLVRLQTALESGELHAPLTRRVLNRITPPPGQRISVIIPTLNEERRIPAQLEALARLPGLYEILVVDGGSDDRTAELVEHSGVAHLLAAPRGRASQMNAGAAAAAGDHLLFLHADVSLPADAARWINRTLADPRTVAGAFRIHTVDDSGQIRWGPLLRLADLRSRYSGLPYGDQAIFVRRDAFDAIGGFPALPLMEDLELSRRLRQRGAIRTVPAEVRVSGRRFVARPIYFTVLINVYPWLYRLGVPPELLARLYGDPR